MQTRSRLADADVDISGIHTRNRLNVILTLKAPITTAADEVLKFTFCFTFHRK